MRRWHAVARRNGQGEGGKSHGEIRRKRCIEGKSKKWWKNKVKGKKKVKGKEKKEKIERQGDKRKG
jgi:hypothetical protein